MKTISQAITMTIGAGIFATMFVSQAMAGCGEQARYSPAHGAEPRVARDACERVGGDGERAGADGQMCVTHPDGIHDERDGEDGTTTADQPE